MTTADARVDFADWVSPMLVKELRQGMRSRVFMLAFFVTQILMIISVSFSLGASEAGGDTYRVFDAIFWMLVGVPLLFIMPIRAFGGVGTEIRAQTLDLILLTHLSAWRVLLGKWTALMAQTLLLVCAMLPYVALRYFLGGVNLIEDLQTILFLIIASATLTAITLSVSPYQSRVLRSLFVIGFIFMLQAVPVVIGVWVSSSAMLGVAAPGPALNAKIYLAILFYIPAFILFALQSGAARIAPPAENHAIVKRLAGFAFIAAAPLLALCGVELSAVIGYSILCLTVVAAESLTESVSTVPSLYRPFLRRGLGGRLMGSILLPGWPFALIYVLFTSALVALIIFAMGAKSPEPGAATLLALLAIVLLPAALVRLTLPRTTHFLAFYLGLQIFFTLVTLFLQILAESGGGNPVFRGVLSLIPHAVFLISATDSFPKELAGTAQVAMWILCGGSVALLAALAIRPLAEIRESIRRSDGGAS